MCASTWMRETWGKKIVNEVDKDSYRVSIGLKYSF